MYQILKTLLRVDDEEVKLVGYRGRSTVDPGIIYAPYIPIEFDPLYRLVSGCTREYNGGKEISKLN